jgi:hypothetical protein
MSTENSKIKDLTEQELLSQLVELRKKQKEMEEQNKDVEFNKQRNFLIKTLRDFLEIHVTDAEVCAVLFGVYGRHTNTQQIPISYYLKKEDENMLYERQIYNRYAKCCEIRYEDSFEIIRNFIGKIKSKDQMSELNTFVGKPAAAAKKESKIGFSTEHVYRPLFC